MMQANWLHEGDSLGDVIDPSTLKTHGVHYQALATDEAGYQPTMDELKEKHGYIEQDQVALTPETENLESICAKFVDEHLHDEDEVRFVLEGAGIFDIRSKDDRWMRVLVEAGDLIVVPAKRYHRFFLTEANTIRCVRLFQDPGGWVPHYRAS